MKYSTKIWTALNLYKRREMISFPVFQRGNIWSDKDRSHLIDSMLKGIDIPKFYLYRTPAGWDVIDGQQRIRAIVGFFDEEVTDDDGRAFGELSEREKSTIENYPLTITEVEKFEGEEEIRELFIRLNLGIPINSGERLNAIKSKLGDFVKLMTKTPFIRRLSIPTRRFAKEQVCAQICNNSIYLNKTGDYRNSKYEDLENLYRAHSDFDFKSPEAKGVMHILDKLNEIFSQDAAEIRNRAGAVSIYSFAERMEIEGRLSGKEDIIKRFYLEFLKNIQEQTRLGIDATNRFLVNYQSRVIQAADSKMSIKDRAEKLEEAFNFYIKHNRIIGFDRTRRNQ